MSVSDADVAFAHDLFSPLGTITSRRMMGGLSIYCDGRIFSIISSAGDIYLKADGALAGRLANAGARQFSSLDKTGKTRSMGYWSLPENALDDMELACAWASEALNKKN
ncbi:MAG: TfoX/Sxy family protein [Paracoccaceae bacterium]